MAKNIEMQYYNGSSYEVVYPKTNLANVTGTLPIANGGTGATTASAALTALGAFPNNASDYSGSYNDMTDGVWRVLASATDGPTAIASVAINKTWDTNFAIQLVFDNSGDTYWRFKLGGSWAGWEKMVSTVSGRLTERVNANIDVQATLAALTLRNIYAKTTDMTAGSTPLQTGMLCLIYE